MEYFENIYNSDETSANQRRKKHAESCAKAHSKRKLKKVRR